MKKTITLLAASTAMATMLGMSARSAENTAPGAGIWPFTAIFGEDGQAPLILVGDDDDRGWRDGKKRRHHDDDDDDDECEGDDDDDDGCGGRGRNAAPAGTVAPPKNGLFGTGAPPQVQMN